MKLADLFPPGADLCRIPSGVPPAGQVSNLKDPPTLRVLITVFGITFTAWATVFAFGRFYANIRKLVLSDGTPRHEPERAPRSRRSRRPRVHGPPSRHCLHSRHDNL